MLLVVTFVGASGTNAHTNVKVEDGAL